MPFADFSLVFSDPEIGADFFTVLRRGSGDDSHGRSNPTVVKTFPNEANGSDQPYGIITWASPNDLVNLPDQEHQQKTISIDTPFRLKGPIVGQLPDIVRWHGDDFVVTVIDDATNFGPGFVHALAQRLDANVPLLGPSRPWVYDTQSGIAQGFSPPQHGTPSLPPPSPPPPSLQPPVVPASEAYIPLGTQTVYHLANGTVLYQRALIADNLGLAQINNPVIHGSFDVGSSVTFNQNFQSIEPIWDGTQWVLA